MKEISRWPSDAEIEPHDKMRQDHKDFEEALARFENSMPGFSRVRCLTP